MAKNPTNPTNPTKRAAQEAALEAAREAQTAFWDALLDLEVALGGIEIDDNADLSETDLDTLLAGDDGPGDDATDDDLDKWQKAKEAAE